MISHATSTPEDDAGRSWVWHGTAASRAAGKVSVLACVETLLAVALHGWMALRWGMHGTVVVLVCLAPMLLLRSPESAQLARRWFMQRDDGVKRFKSWPRWKRWLCVAVAGAAGCVTECTLVLGLIRRWREGRSFGDLAAWGMFFGSWSLAIAAAVAFVVALLGARVGRNLAVVALSYAAKWLGAFVVAGLVLGVFMLMFNFAVMDLGMSSIAYMVGGAVMGTGLVLPAAALVVVGTVLGTALGLWLRAFVCGVRAALRHLPQGLRQMGKNWRESTFSVDSCVPAELLPGIRAACDDLVDDGIHLRTVEEKSRALHWVFEPLLAGVCFLAALLYRLNLKATCWFWWPLGWVGRREG